MTDTAAIPTDIAAALAAPFEAKEVKFKPAVVTGNRALALPYVDARVVMDRLDEVVGVDCWQDSYEVLPGGEVVCTLRVKIGDEWVSKMDVGGQSEQPDEGDRVKAAFSDALKRTAVKFGVGRYLYRQPSQWCDYDPKKKQFVKTPMLPPESSKFGDGLKKTAAPAAKAPAPAAALPADGAGLADWIARLDQQLVEKGLAKVNEMRDEVWRETAKVKGHLGAVEKWPADAVRFAAQHALAFARQRKEGRAKAAEGQPCSK
jgi:hypothetical protein